MDQQQQAPVDQQQQALVGAPQAQSQKDRQGRWMVYLQTQTCASVQLEGAQDQQYHHQETGGQLEY